MGGGIVVRAMTTCCVIVLILGAVAFADDADKQAKLRTAVVTDQTGVEWTVEEAGFYLPDSGLFGVGKAKRQDSLRLWQGAHQLLVPLARIMRVETIGPSKEDAGLLSVKVVVVGEEAVVGQVDIEMELRGQVRVGDYQIKIERAKKIVFK